MKSAQPPTLAWCERRFLLTTTASMPTDTDALVLKLLGQCTDPRLEYRYSELPRGDFFYEFVLKGTDTLHREDGPAQVVRWGNSGGVDVNWHYDAALHRDDGPAIERYTHDGRCVERVWYQHGKRHRIGAPALIGTLGDGRRTVERWMVDDQLHREDGPAFVRYLPNGQVDDEVWYVRGRILSADEVSDLKIINFANSVLGSQIVGDK